MAVISFCCWTKTNLLLPGAVAAAADEIVEAAATATLPETKDTGGSDTNNNNNNKDTATNDDFDEDEIVRETIAAGRGDREEQGIRDQWASDEHLQRQFDSRKPISAEVGRLLEAYQLSCEGCDHERAVRKVNAYVRETKRRLKEEGEARARRDSWARRIFGALVVIGVSTACVYRKELGLEFLFRNGNRGSNKPEGGMSLDRAELLRRRQHAADAASQRREREQKEQQKHQPTWLDNERKEVWTAKQEKQFQKALKEFSGVRKNERYKLIAEKVQGKSRIECLTHHRMQELLAKHPNE